MEIISAVAKGLLPAFFVLAVMFVFSIPMLKESVELKRRAKFRKHVRLGITRNQLSYEDMQHIAERWLQDRKALLLSLRVLHSEAISGEDEELSKEVQAIRDLIKIHQEQEPYSELPENIGLQLSQLADSEGVAKDIVGQLASSLSDLYLSNQLMLTRQVRFTFWSVVAGVTGVLIGVAGLYFAVSASVV